MTAARRLLAGAILIAALVAGCAPLGASPSPTAFVPPSSPIVGIVTLVKSEGLDQVSGFDLRDATGHVYTFTIGQLENPTAFPPGHLAEHQITAEPVRVWFRSDDRGYLVAYRLEDAGATSSPSP